MFTDKKKYRLPFLMALLLLSLACATSVPFLGTAPETAPIQVIDQNAIETMIAEAVDQKVAETLAAIPPTKIPTETPADTPVPSPTSTEIPITATPTEVEIVGAGNELKENEDGSLTYLDYVGAYQVNLPPSWMALRPGSTEYAEALLLPEASIPEISASLETMRELDANTFRLFLFDTQEGHYANGFVNNINIVLGEENKASLEETFAQSVLALPDSIEGLVVTTADITKTSQGLSIGNISSEWDAENTAVQSIRAYQKQTIFIVKDRPMVITLSSTADFEEQAVAIYDILVENLTLVD